MTCTDGATLACRVEGDGPPVVMLHGLACIGSTWRAVADALVRDGYQVVTVDLRGHGESTMGSRDLSLSQLAADVVSVLESLDLRDAVLVGHSAGGYHALAAATDRSAFTRVRAVVTFGTHGEVHSVRERAVLRFSASRLFYALFSVAPLGRTLVRAGAFGSAPEPSLVEQTRRDALQCPRAVKRAHVRATTGTSVLEEVKGLTVPFVAVTGSADAVATPNRIRDLAASSPHGRAIVLEGVRHMAIVEAPELVAEIIATA